MKRKPWQPDKEHRCIVGAQERAGAPGHCAIPVRTQSKACLHLRPARFLPGVKVCTLRWEGSNWTFSGSLSAGMRLSSSILLLRFHVLFQLRVMPQSCPYIFAPPLIRDFALDGWACTHLQVASPVPILIAAAGGLFKKLSDSFGSNSSFQGDLEERKCDINLT